MLDSETYDINKDIEVIKIIDKDELSPYSVNMYLVVLKQFCDSVGKPYYEIITEIKQIQRDKIIGNEIIRYNPNDSLINDYIHKFIHYLISRNNQKSSINLKTRQLLLLLKKSNIEVPKIQFKTEAKQTKVQLLTCNDINFILRKSSVYHKALITFMASTGIRRYDIVNSFKIEDFMESCSDYINASSLEEFLEYAPYDMIPYFEFVPNKTKKTGLPCKVCCSSEASNWIINSLKSRMKSIERHNKEFDDNLVLDEEAPLFSSKKKNYIGKLKLESVSGLFYEKNKLLKAHNEKILDDLLQEQKITKKEWKIKKETMPKFHPHSLRHRFISVLREHTTNRDISLLMEGHASSINTDKYYVGESNELFNKDSIKKTYLQVMPYLTFLKI